jgi:hypothetical protein
MTRWLGPLQEGNHPDPAKQLWERYFVTLVQLARKQLAGVQTRKPNGEG